MNHSIGAAFLSAFLGLLGLTACSSSSSASCTAQLTGNTTESATLSSNCGVVTFSPATDDAGADAGSASDTYVLNLSANTKDIAQVKVSIDLGASPAVGSFSSENVASWSLTAVSTNGESCVYSAGTESVPVGSFTLTLKSVDVASGGTGQAHGTLALTAYVHAPPNADCGAGDTEDIVFDF